MSDFQLFEMAWKNSWISEQEMNKAVELGIITKDDYQKITGNSLN
ncbi:XkdX family protein [Paenibacillus taichungensis]